MKCWANIKTTRLRRKRIGAGSPAIEASFTEVVDLIEQARLRAYQAINTELVGLYWRIG